jgi:hypothetical protein
MAPEAAGSWCGRCSRQHAGDLGAVKATCAEAAKPGVVDAPAGVVDDHVQRLAISSASGGRGPDSSDRSIVGSSEKVKVSIIQPG